LPTDSNYTVISNELNKKSSVPPNQKKWFVASCDAIEDIISSLQLENLRH
jgi:hypothetical protein